MRRIEAYFNDIAQAIQELTSLLCENSIFAILGGEPTVLGVQAPVHRISLEVFDTLDYKIQERFFDRIKARNLFKGRQNMNPEGMRGEWLIIAKKTG